jgi:polyhydroxyalkanoate synthesis regulator phasin
MATTKTDDVIGRLSAKGEEALQKLTDLPGGSRTLQAFNDLRNRVDALSKRIRGIHALEQRVTKLEKEVASLRRAQKPASSQSPTRKASP